MLIAGKNNDRFLKNKVTEKFFRLNWLSQFTRWNRMLANASGRNMVFSHARFLSSNMKRLDLTSVEELPQTGRYKVYAEQLREEWQIEV